MSGQQSEADAMDVGFQAATWLERRYHDAWNEADQVALDSWLAQSLAHRIAYLRLEDAWRYADRLSALRNVAHDIPRRANRRRTIFRGMAAFAIVIAAIGVGVAAYLNAPHEQVYTTAVGGHEHFALNDGSQVELNTDTVLRLSDSASRRIVTLEKGEAYFQVTHDAKRPFVVIADGERITDLGTKFLVRAYPHKVRVAVFDGRVQFDPAAKDGNKRTALLTAGDVLLATNNSQSVQRKSTALLAKDLGWRQGVITLDNTALADAAAEFNRYNTKKLIVADSETAHLKIMGTFRADNVGAFVSVAQDIFGLRVENRNSETVISR
ncbi:MAG TPA: FecR domain-containing protein [Rhizomicrobium sp.]|jgi:transmembrane sensor|nr:FecR domain-containing protein [Rhizomicrobium sp.]